jgi:transcriptional regulator with XRE-family HTH domain
MSGDDRRDGGQVGSSGANPKQATARQSGQGPSPDELGRRLRAVRVARGMSLRAVAKLIDVSPSFVSQVELGKATPSVGTLYALVTALGLSLDDVMTEQPATTTTEPTAGPPGWPRIDERVQRASGRRTIRMSGVTWERLTPGDDPWLDFLAVTYEPGSASCPPDDLMRHGGREYGHIVRGRMLVQVGFETYDLHQDDSIHFDSLTPHRLSNPFDEPCEAVWVVVDRRGDSRMTMPPRHLPTAT